MGLTEMTCFKDFSSPGSYGPFFPFLTITFFIKTFSPELFSNLTIVSTVTFLLFFMLPSKLAEVPHFQLNDLNQHSWDPSVPLF